MKSPGKLPRLGFLATLFVLGGCASLGFGSGGSRPATFAEVTAAGRTAITTEGVALHVSALSADSMRGRDTPSPELDKAAEYISAHFAQAGLEPAGDGGTFLQRWIFTRIALDIDRSAAEAQVGDTHIVWEYGTDYFAIPSPPIGIQGVPVFAGSPAAVAGGLPPETAGRPLMVYLPDGISEEVGLVIGAALTSRATGLVFLMGPETGESEIYQLMGAFEAGAAGELPLPIIGLSYAAGQALLTQLGVTSGGSAPPEMLSGITLTVLSSFVSMAHLVPNVAGILRGADPVLSDSYIVLTAHFDHVGVGPADSSGDTIYNGADDNASGTSLLMEIAAAFAALPSPPARSVLFLAVSGEEKGLLGSAYFAAVPTVPIGSIVANLNMDMVGRNHPDTVYLIGENYTTLGAAAHQAAGARPEISLVLASDPEPDEQIFLRSDHYSFVEKGIPALMFTTGLHDDYHLPSDAAEAIDAEKTARIGRLIFYLTHALASDPVDPEWTEEGEALLREVLGR